MMLLRHLPTENRIIGMQKLPFKSVPLPVQRFTADSVEFAVLHHF